MNIDLPTIIANDVEGWNDAFARENDIDEYYASAPTLIRFVERRRLRWIWRTIAAKPTDRILEVGCGGGHVLRMFPEAELTGVDVSGRMLEKAARNLSGLRVRLLKGQLHELHLASGSFDKLICTEVLEHVEFPEVILGEMARLVRSGGMAVVTFPNDRLIHRIQRLLIRSGLSRLRLLERISWGGDAYHLHVWRIGEMRELLERYFHVSGLWRVPFSWLPIRCCFLCTAK